jgi:ribosomal protein S14
MLFFKVKDKKTREKVNKQELLNSSLKFVYTNFLNKRTRKWALPPLYSFNQKEFSKTKIVRRCIMHNRSRGSIRPFHISRIKFRELLQFGIVPGYKKSVW